MLGEGLDGVILVFPNGNVVLPSYVGPSVWLWMEMGCLSQPAGAGGCIPPWSPLQNHRQHPWRIIS